MSTVRRAGARPVSARAAASPPKQALPLRLGRAVLARIAARPGRTASVLGIAAASGLFLWNVLLAQANKHPAPLFRAPVSTQPVTAASPAPRLPVPRPDPAPATRLAAAPPAALDASPTRTDAIGTLIRASDGGARPAETRPDAARVAAVQRALSKLGYGPLKADGIMGATTRQAIERFEKDKNLPVTGSATGRTGRQLAAASGLTIE